PARVPGRGRPGRTRTAPPHRPPARTGWPRPVPPRRSWPAARGRRRPPRTGCRPWAAAAPRRVAAVRVPSAAPPSPQWTAPAAARWWRSQQLREVGQLLADPLGVPVQDVRGVLDLLRRPVGPHAVLRDAV